MSSPTPIRDRIVANLTEGFAPQRLEVIDESAKHAGHAGHDKRGESHFKVLIVAAAFENKTRIARHRLIYAALQKELTDRIHALQILAVAPSEVREDS